MALFGTLEPVLHNFSTLFLMVCVITGNFYTFCERFLIYYPRAAKLASLAPGRKMAMAPARGQGRVERMRGLPALMFSFDQGNIIEIY
jgi:hypothetical protein